MSPLTWVIPLVFFKARFDEVSPFLMPAIAVIGLLIVMWIVSSRIAPYREKLFAEMQAGYMTDPKVSGHFWEPGQGIGGRLGQIRWNTRGCWVLALDGTVISQPDRSFDPPGFYPSPNEPGRMELWSGEEWTGYCANRA